MITITAPNTSTRERHYTVSVIFKEFLGHDFQFLDGPDVKQPPAWEIKSSEQPGRLILPDIFFSKAENQWLLPASMPVQPMKSWQAGDCLPGIVLTAPEVPVIYGKDPTSSGFFKASENEICLGLDIFGSAFFMLTRYEEQIKPDRDEHERFPASASLAYQEGFLDRPIVNEYIEILWAAMKCLWPGLKRKKQSFRMFLTHDVDRPYKIALDSLPRFMKRMAGDVLLRKDLKCALNRPRQWRQIQKGFLDEDPYNTFDWIMAQSESYGLKSAFYFVPDAIPRRDGSGYPLDAPAVQKLMQTIHQRGHEVGYHGSYKTFLNAVRTKNEANRFQSICRELSIHQKQWGGRQHYLRWQAPDTWQNWDEAGFDYDSTVSYADFAGFRCGTCYPFSAYNLQTRTHLRLIERPLVVMECSVMDDHYMGLGSGQVAFDYMAKLKDRCRVFGGEFVLLWHNTRLMEESERALYKSLLEH
ncbi:MAG: polysaccharide deacetylase family protein [Desulfosalsimonas sp.]